MLMLSHISHIWLFATLWAVVWQVPLSMGFSRQEYWSGLPCPPPGHLPDPGIKPASPASPALAGRFFTTESPGNPVPKTEQAKNTIVAIGIAAKMSKAFSLYFRSLWFQGDGGGKPRIGREVGSRKNKRAQKNTKSNLVFPAEHRAIPFTYVTEPNLGFSQVQESQSNDIGLWWGQVQPLL